MARSPFCSGSLLLDMILIPEQDSPSCPREKTIHNGNPRREPEHLLPTDEPEQVGRRTGRVRCHPSPPRHL